eukprot:4258418-Ditylum_brightwellii.AAC.1
MSDNHSQELYRGRKSCHNECTKVLHHTYNTLKDLNLCEETHMVNDHMACVNWAYNMMIKGLHHIQMRKSTVCEVVQSNFSTISHVGGKVNLSDILTQEDVDKAHFFFAEISS